MPLDWEMVKEKYGGEDAWFPTIAGGKKVKVTGVTDNEIFVATRLNPKVPIKRENLEKMVELIETRRVAGDAGTLTEDYRTLIEDNLPTYAISMLKDIGYVK